MSLQCVQEMTVIGLLGKLELESEQREEAKYGGRGRVSGAQESCATWNMRHMGLGLWANAGARGERC